MRAGRRCHSTGCLARLRCARHRRGGGQAPRSKRSSCGDLSLHVCVSVRVCTSNAPFCPFFPASSSSFAAVVELRFSVTDEDDPSFDGFSRTYVAACAIPRLSFLVHFFFFISRKTFSSLFLLCRLVAGLLPRLFDSAAVARERARCTPRLFQRTTRLRALLCRVPPTSARAGAPVSGSGLSSSS